MNCFRSEPMVYCQLMLRIDSAFDCISELGELGMVQFKDTNNEDSSFKKKYVPNVRRCEELERQLNFLMKEMKRRDIPIPENRIPVRAATEKMMTEFETEIERLEREVKMVCKNLDLLAKDFKNMMQMKCLMKKTQLIFEQVENFGLPDVVAFQDVATGSYLDTKASTTPLVSRNESRTTTYEPIQISSKLDQSEFGHSFNLRIVTGVISSERLLAFEKILFRVSHGNVFMKSSTIEVPISGWNSTNDLLPTKAVFVIFLQGDQLMNKVLKVCGGFHADIYSCPSTSQARRRMSIDVMTRLEDLNIVLNQTQDHLLMLLSDASQNLAHWSMSVMKAKAVYHTLNMLNYDSSTKTLLGEGWCPQSEFNNVQVALAAGAAKAGMTESSAIFQRLKPTGIMPTYHKANKFSVAVQGIVDAYGVSEYMEINPAIFSTITFPFLFSIMFGDCGHGILLTLFSLFLITFQNRLSRVKSETFALIFSARHLLLLMGLFTMYSGLMYNDFFARPIKLFQCQWIGLDSDSLVKRSLDPALDSEFRGYPYPMGMDPLWQISDNKVRWLNSFKMKLSVILGVFHMSFGIFLKFMNQRYTKNTLNLVCEVLPQTIFLMSTFGYLVCLIFHKWIAYDARSSSIAPNLLTGFINMFLMNYPTEPPSAAVSGNQKILQCILLVSALICVPWMLMIKPYVIYNRMKKNTSNSNNRPVAYRPLRTEDYGAEDVRLLLDSGSDDDDDANQFNESASSSRHGGEGHVEEFSDIVVEQCIFTIEFCLGCVSHTASYLRLWALSLAHGELSEVLWNSFLSGSFSVSSNPFVGGLFGFCMFSAWATLTVVILMFMECLSAFLHTLRLHWIEFMSKFFKGGGKPFKAFSLDHINMQLLEEIQR